MGYCVYNFEEKNELNPSWTKAVTSQNVEKVKRFEYFPDAMYNHTFKLTSQDIMCFFQGFRNNLPEHNTDL